jgi:hypothetical protein
MSRASMSILVSLCGCFPAARAPIGVAGNGQPLAVVERVRATTTMGKANVDEVEHRDAMGTLIATSTTYRDAPIVHVTKVWYPMQGTERLTDEEFFAIAGDQQSLQATLDLRTRGEAWRRRGKVAAAVGVVGVIANVFITPFVTDDTRAYLAVWCGSAVLAIGGYTVSAWGARQLRPEAHAVDRSTAERAARHYNQRLGAPGLTMTRSF